MNYLLRKYVEIADMARASTAARTHIVSAMDRELYHALSASEKEIMFDTLNLNATDPDHVEIAMAVLQRLSFRAKQDRIALLNLEWLCDVGILLPRTELGDRIENVEVDAPPTVSTLDDTFDRIESKLDLLIANSNRNDAAPPTTAQSATPQSHKRSAAVLETPVLLRSPTSFSSSSPSSSSSARRGSKQQQLQQQQREEDDEEGEEEEGGGESASPPKKRGK